MTFTEIQARVQHFFKINGADTEMATFIAEAINIAYFEIARESRWPELLVYRHPVSLTGAAAGGVLPLPVGFLQISRVRFTDTSNTRTWPLADRMGRVPPAPVPGLPRAYSIVKNTVAIPSGIILEPFAAISDAGDFLRIDYYETPVLLSAGADVLRSPAWDPLVIKRALHYVGTYQGKIEVAREMWATSLGQMKRSGSQSQSEE